jgi:hypothetical protein
MLMRPLLGSLLISWQVYAQIRVLSPLSLEQDSSLASGIIYGTTAIFGAPEYGRRTLGEVVYYTALHNHCEETDFDKYPSKDITSHDVKIFVVDRGGCPFEKKVRLAQERGADAVIVVDLSCSKQKELAISEGHPDTPCRDSESIQRIIMADTSGARDIHIPSVLIAREQGERLISAITAYQTASTGENPNASEKEVVVMLLWDIPRSEFVSVDFWMSSAATDTGFFMSQFAPIAKELGNQIQFVPRYSVKQMSRFEVYKTSNCLETKLPSNDETVYFCDSRLSHFGKSAVQEDLRQLCIWHATAKASSTPSGKVVTSSDLYWDYVVESYQSCHPARASDPSESLTESCANKVMKRLGINTDDVNWCLGNMKPPVCQSGLVQRAECASSFHLLQDQAAHQAWSPHALRINGWRYSGPLEASVVLKTICQGYSSVPEVCHHIPSVGLASMYGGISTGMAWFLGLSMVCLVLLAFIVYRRNLQKTLRSVLREEVMLEVRSQMADYAMLAEDEEAVPKVLELTRFTPQQSRSQYRPRE